MKPELLSTEAAEKEWREFLEENDATALLPNEALKDSADKTDRDTYISQKVNFDKIIKALTRGNVIISNGIISQKLQYPILDTENQPVHTELVFDKRWTAKDRQEIYRGLDMNKTNEVMQIQARLCAKLTGIDTAILGKLDSRDQKVTDQIVNVFFM